MALELGVGDIDPQKVETWPGIMKFAVVIILLGVIFVAGWYAVIQEKNEQYESAIATVESLKKEYKEKAKQAVNLPAYREQIAELETLLEAQLRQLPNSNEVANLLDDISFIAQDNGLNLISIKWEPEVQQDIYTELPMSIFVTGTYEQLGSFSADMAALPRIVTIDNFTLNHVKAEKPTAETMNILEMKLLAKTFRYNAEQAKKASERRERLNKRRGGR